MASTVPAGLELKPRKHRLSNPSSITLEAESDHASESSNGPFKSQETLEPEANNASEPNGPPAQEFEEVSGFKLFSIMTAVTLVCFLMLLDSSIISTAIPHITNQFHSLPDVGWYGSAYQLASATLQPLTGKFYMNFKAKWTFLAFFSIFEVGSLICGVATSSKMLIVGRAVSGMGTGGILNGAMTIVAGLVPMEKRPTLIGIAMGVSQLGLIGGPLIGGVLTQYASWRWCFYINLPIGGLVAILLVFVRIPDQITKPDPMSVIRSLPSKFDLIGFAIFAPAAIQLLLALQYGGTTFAWNSAQIIGLFCGAGSTFILFLFWDYHKGDEAMIPFSMARQRIVWSSCLVYGFLMGQTFCASYYLPIYFQAVKGVSPTLSGVYLLPSILSHIFAAVSSGVLLGIIGYYIPISVTSAVLVATANGLMSTFSTGTSTGKWIGYQIILGAGRGIGIQMPIIAVQNTLDPAQLPVAMALVMFSQSFSGAVFLSLSDVIFNNSLATYLPKYAPNVNARAIIDAGATGFRNIVSGADLAGVLAAYSKSVDRVFYMTAGMAVVCFTFAWGMGWTDMRKKKEVSKV